MRTVQAQQHGDANGNCSGGADNYRRKYGRPWDDETRGLYWCEAVFHQAWVSPDPATGPERAGPAGRIGHHLCGAVRMRSSTTAVSVPCRAAQAR